MLRQIDNVLDSHQLKKNTRKFSVIDLTPGEIFIIWAIRHWIGSVLEQVCPEPMLREGCRSVSMERLAPTVGLLMSAIIPSSIDLDWASRMEYRKVVTGEKNIPYCVHLIQIQAFVEISNFSKIWLQPSVHRVSYECFLEIGDILMSRKHFFPFRELVNTESKVSLLTEVTIY